MDGDCLSKEKDGRCQRPENEVDDDDDEDEVLFMFPAHLYHDRDSSYDSDHSSISEKEKSQSPRLVKRRERNGLKTAMGSTTATCQFHHSNGLEGSTSRVEDGNYSLNNSLEVVGEKDDSGKATHLTNGEEREETPSCVKTEVITTGMTLRDELDFALKSQDSPSTSETSMDKDGYVSTNGDQTMLKTRISRDVESANATRGEDGKITAVSANKTYAKPRTREGPALASKANKKTVYSFDEVIDILQEKIQALLKHEDYTSVQMRAELKFVCRTTRYSPDVLLNKRIIDRLVTFGIVHVFLQVWKSVTTVDFMAYDQNLPAFKNLQTALSTIWNCTDKSAQLCESLIRTHALHALLAELGSEKLSGSDLNNDNNLYLVKAYLGILHNVARLCSDSRRVFRDARAVTILQWYLNSANDLIKTNAYMILSYVITEDENDVINATDDNLRFIVGVLEDALNSENHFSKKYGFWALEVVCGLNHLAVNDANKVRMGACGALSLYVRLLQTGSEEEQGPAASGLWILSFKDDNKALLREEPGCIEVLKKLAVSGSTESMRRAARGALWIIQSDRPALQTFEDADIPHVMVSYHHKSGQAMMIKVVRRLRQAGFKIWMDLDDMHGSTLEAMALAIERSCCILVCMSQGYKDSPSCRTEAEYTYRLRKDVIPLLLQDGYSPDGWLGAFVGTRLHFDFSTEDKIAVEIQKLIRELGIRGKLPKRRMTNYRTVSSGTDSCDAMTLSSSFSSSTTSHSYVKQSASQWTAEDIRTWLEPHLLSHIYDRLEPMNGELILQLKRMMRSAPEYFYNTLDHKLKFDLTTILRFTKALDELA